MNVPIVFNHHSLPFSTSEAAREKIPEFIKICLSARRTGFSPILIDYTQDITWYRIQLAKDYYWSDWVKEKKHNPQDRDLISAFNLIATKTPLLEQEEMDEAFDLLEPFPGTKFIALRASAFFNLPLVSFPTCKPWTQSSICVNCLTLDNYGDSHEKEVHLVNWFSYESFNIYKNSIKSENEERISSGKQLLEEFNTQFPLIKLCGNAPKQLNKWSASHELLNEIRESLTILNLFAEKWNNNEIIDYSHVQLRMLGLNHAVSGESQSVLNNPKKISARQFHLPNGDKIIFENHIKFSQGFRLHFFPDHKTKTIFIGHIGNHLLI
jgi:hypothetical protein